MRICDDMLYRINIKIQNPVKGITSKANIVSIHALMDAAIMIVKICNLIIIYCNSVSTGYLRQQSKQG